MTMTQKIPYESDECLSTRISSYFISAANISRHFMIMQKMKPTVMNLLRYYYYNSNAFLHNQMIDRWTKNIINAVGFNKLELPQKQQEKCERKLNWNLCRN